MSPLRTLPSIVLVALGLLLLGSDVGVRAESLPNPGKVDSRIRSVPYSADQVYRLYGLVGYHLDLEFAADESFVGLSAGDPEALIYSAHENVLTLRPKAPSVHMNVTVTTNKRRYYLDYSATAKPAEHSDGQVMYAVRFIYPPVTAAGPTPAEQVNTALEHAERRPPQNVDYWYCGNPAIKPVAASDDGVQTRLTFGARSELPAFFVLADDGSESLLNFSIDQGDVIIQRVTKRFVLRRGKLTGCIVNKGFVGGGERLKSGTITPAVTRERKELPP